MKKMMEMLLSLSKIVFIPFQLLLALLTVSFIDSVSFGANAVPDQARPNGFKPRAPMGGPRPGMNRPMGSKS